MIEYGGETYLTVSEIAKRFKLSRVSCYANLVQQMQKCYLPGRKHALYRLSEIEQFSVVRMESHRRVFPAPTTTEETGNGATSSPNALQHSLDWQSQYTPAVQSTQVTREV